MGSPIHWEDEQCDLDSEDVCRVCGVWHGDPCPSCGGRGFHRPGCEDSDGFDHPECGSDVDPESGNCRVCGVYHGSLPLEFACK